MRPVQARVVDLDLELLGKGPQEVGDAAVGVLRETALVVGQAGDLTGSTDHQQVGGTSGQRPKDIEVIAGEVLDLIDEDVGEHAAEPVDNRAAARRVATHHQFRQLVRKDPAAVVEKVPGNIVLRPGNLDPGFVGEANG